MTVGSEIVIKWRSLSPFVKPLVALGLVAFLLTSGQVDVRGILARPLVLFHPVGLGLGLLVLLLQTVRWWWLLRAQHVPARFWQVVQLAWVGQFFAVVSPGAIGSDFIRAYYVARDDLAGGAGALSTVLFDRVFGLYALLWLGLVPIIASPLTGELSPAVMRLASLLGLSLLAATGAGFGLAWPPFRAWLWRWLPPGWGRALETVFVAYSAAPGLLPIVLGLSLVGHGFLAATYLVASQTLQLDLDWRNAVVTVPLVVIANSLPISPGGLGVSEMLGAAVLTRLGTFSGATIILLVRWWLLLLRLPGGLIYALNRGAWLTAPGAGDKVTSHVQQ